LNFIDPELGHRETLNQVLCEHEERIENLIKQLPLIQNCSVYGAKCAFNVSSYHSHEPFTGTMTTSNAPKAGISLIQHKRSSLIDRKTDKKSSMGCKYSDSDSIKISDQKTRQNTNAPEVEQTSSKNQSTVALQFAPDAEEVKSLYKDKESGEIVRLLLQNLSHSNVFNKNEHIVQFWNLYFK